MMDVDSNDHKGHSSVQPLERNKDGMPTGFGPGIRRMLSIGQLPRKGNHERDRGYGESIQSANPLECLELLIIFGLFSHQICTHIATILDELGAPMDGMLLSNVFKNQMLILETALA